jgi:ATP-dependent DNA helicase RecQ
MTETPLEILNTIFGFSHFLGEQELIINHVMAGGNALVLMPTGGGKSLCYQIPALIRPGVAVVVSPLISLMQDQVTALQQLGIRAAALNSSLDFEQRQIVSQQLRQNQLDLLYVSPEKLMTPHLLEFLETVEIALFAIDEAHCISQWGHDFRREYMQLSILPERFPSTPRLALTATADFLTRKDIITKLKLEKAKIFIASFNRANIRYQVVLKHNARQQLLDFLRKEGLLGEAGIVYCLTRNEVEKTAQWMTQKGLSALPYHAGLTQLTRQHNQSRFLREEGLIIVATVAFGMGIDKSNVRFVAHLDLPRSIEAYYQETGRAGRDGLPAIAWMSYGLKDVIMLRKMMEQSEADEQHKWVERQKLEKMLAYCEMISCRRQALLDYFGEQLPTPCGNCDTCLEPVETWDGTQAAQKALSCVYRTGQRFGVNYLIEVLLGKMTERVRKFNHQNLSTFGIGSELNEQQWHSVFRQLIARGFVAVNMEGYSTLQLTEQARSLLRGEQSLLLRKDIYQTSKKEELKYGHASRQVLTGNDKILYETLRAKRLELSQNQEIPPYLIFHDSTLQEIVRHRPRTLEDFSRLSGVGAQKLERYGQIFLNLLEDHILQYEDSSLQKSVKPTISDANIPADDSFSNTVTETVLAFQSGQSPQEIAQQRQLKISTIHGHLAQAIEQGRLKLRDVIKITEEEIHEIEEVLLEIPTEELHTLKPVFEAFAGTYDYGILKCIRANLWRKIKEPAAVYHSS